MNGHILLVEDDDKLRKMLARVLSRAGYEVTQVTSGEAAIDLLQPATASEQKYDVVLTDIVLGSIDSVGVTQVAIQQPDAPEVILLTGQGSLETAVAALRHGAFDYLFKPAEISHLLERLAAAVARRRARLQRDQEASMLRKITEVLMQSQEEEVLVSPDQAETVLAATELQRYRLVGELRIDTYRHKVWLHAEQVHLTPTEYAILVCLAEMPGQVVRYEEIIRRTHRQTMPRDDAHSLLTSHVRNIRRKIDPHYLISVRGVGYMLTDPQAPEHPEE